jgi:hypothetical protein
MNSQYSVHEKESASTATSIPEAVDLLVMHQAANRMAPVHPSVVVVIVQSLAMLLPEFVGKQKRDDEKRHDQERAKNQMLDHSNLQIDETTTISL